MESPQLGRFINAKGNVHWLDNLLIRWEKTFYDRMMLPDLLIVLRLDPAVAVGRKPSEEPPSVHGRSAEIWRLDWEPTPAYVIEAQQTRERVVSQVESLVWTHL